MTRTVIQIVPRRTDQPDGVGDYATILAGSLFEREAWISTFVSGTPAQVEPPLRDSWVTAPIIARRGFHLATHLAELCKKTNPAAAIVHVSGYGYQKRGAPVWLLNGIRAWRREHPGIRLIGIFHELFATGHMWQSSFWLSNAQRYITRELWRLCDAGIATNQVYFDQLTAWRPAMGDRLKTMPVVSNVGEPRVVAPPGGRPIHMAVFGRPGTEMGVYYGPDTDRSVDVVQKLGIEKIIDIGLRSSLPATLGSTVIVPLGRLPSRLLSEQLGKCRFGLINYDVRRLGKSGVFAAYAAHGVIPVCIQPDSPADGLKEGKHLLQWPLGHVPDDLTKIQLNLREWYQNHSAATQAQLIIDWCSRKRM